MAKLLPVEERALEIIRESGFIDVDRISRKLGVPPADAEKIVKSLEKKGVLSESGCNCERCPLSSICPYSQGKKPRMFVVLRGGKR